MWQLYITFNRNGKDLNGSEQLYCGEGGERGGDEKFAAMQVLHADQLAYRMVAAGGRLRSQGVVVVQGMKSSAILVMRQAMKFAPAIKVPPQKLQAFCSRNHIRKLSLFGSVLTEKFHAGSDLDVLVEFEPGHVPGFFGIAGMQMELSEIFGRKVDLRTPEDLSRYFRSDVLASAAIQYERS